MKHPTTDEIRAAIGELGAEAGITLAGDGTATVSFSRTLTEDERRRLERALAEKYGVSLEPEKP